MNSSIDITNVMLFLLAQPAGGAAVVMLGQFIKKVLHMDSGHAIHAMIVFVSLAAAIVTYILKFRGLPLSVIGLSGPATYGFSQGIYKLCKLLVVVLPKVSLVLAKVSSLFSKRPAIATTNAAPAVDVPLDFAEDIAPAAPAEPAAPDTTGFNF